MMGRDWAKVWVEQGRFQAYFPRLSFAKDGLKLGAGTVIAAIERDCSGVACLKIDGAEERILALLSVAYDRPVAPWVLTNLRNASRALAKEELCQAAIHVAFSGLPSLEDEDAPRRLFLADHLLADGLDEGEMLKALDLLPQAVAVKQWREWAKYGGRSSAVAEAGGMFRKEGGWSAEEHPRGGNPQNRGQFSTSEGRGEVDAENAEKPQDPGKTKIALITVYDDGIGMHSALYVEQGGRARLYDPAGGYMADQRGSNGVVYDGDARLSRYIAYHQGHGSRVEIDEAYVNSEDVQKLTNELDEGVQPMGGLCAFSISGYLPLLREFSQMSWHVSPARLQSEFRDMKGQGK